MEQIKCPRGVRVEQPSHLKMPSREGCRIRHNQPGGTPRPRVKKPLPVKNNGVCTRERDTKVPAVVRGTVSSPATRRIAAETGVWEHPRKPAMQLHF